MKRILLLLLLLLPTSLFAKVQLPAVLNSGMVLQRNSRINLWGEAVPGNAITVRTSWNGACYRTTADAEGKWLLQIATGEAGGPYTITVSDGEPLTLENILLGEVWICSGQSNMEMPVRGFAHQPVEDAARHISAAADFPNIRLFTVERLSREEPQSNCNGTWRTASPQSVASFSATGYFFGRMLAQALGIPVGLIEADWGGSSIETWMTVASIDATPGIDHTTAKAGTSPNSAPQRLYNGMIHPIRRFTAKGFIWYQGESNRHNWYDYDRLMVSLVNLWRRAWNDEQMPFYYVQLAPHNYNGANWRSLPLVIEAQYRALEKIPHAGIAATTDLGNGACIHPARKREVGERLAWLALRNEYGVEGLPAPAPTFRSMTREGNKLILEFNHLASDECPVPDTFVMFGDEGIVTPEGFEIAGADRKFRPAKSAFRQWSNKIEVWSEEIPDPVAVRYAFVNCPSEANVRTTLGQPLAPFRTDDWPVEDTGLK